jgi:hypothetical protein
VVASGEWVCRRKGEWDGEGQDVKDGRVQGDGERFLFCVSANDEKLSVYMEWGYLENMQNAPRYAPVAMQMRPP